MQKNEALSLGRSRRVRIYLRILLMLLLILGPRARNATQSLSTSPAADHSHGTQLPSTRSLHEQHPKTNKSKKRHYHC